MDRMIANMVGADPVVILSKSSCCMCHSIKTLFYRLGVEPKVYELDEIEAGLNQLGHDTTVPAVYIGGEYEGGAREIMTLQINNLLEPKLINVGALPINLAHGHVYARL